MEIRKINNNQTFQAKLLVGHVPNKPRWQKIAQQFENETKNTLPEYKMEVSKDLNKMFNITIKKDSEDIEPRKHILYNLSYRNLMNNTDTKVVQKLTKLLNIVKKRDDILVNAPKDITKIEKKYGIKFSETTKEDILDGIKELVSDELYFKEICNDNILKHFHHSSNIFDFN